jgi:hypothetical protein
MKESASAQVRLIFKCCIGWTLLDLSFDDMCIPDRATFAHTQIHASVAPGLQMMSGLYVSADEAPFLKCVRCGPRYIYPFSLTCVNQLIGTC